MRPITQRRHAGSSRDRKSLHKYRRDRNRGHRKNAEPAR